MVCEHGRAEGQMCPHCLGVNSAVEDGVQLISDALKMRCRRCGGAHLTTRREDFDVAGFPVLVYACRDCGLDSERKTVKVELTRAELDIISLGLQQLKAQYPKVSMLLDHLDELDER